MKRLPFGIVGGLLFGAIDVALMLPLPFKDRPTAFAAAFASRFAIGVLAATTQLPLPAWARGLVVGLLISIPDAIITRAYAPILVTGVIGGTLIGWAAGKWARPD
ncbi:MAG TPA: hypothetical protein VGR02_12315 [Thermoanaerobaculia bacterium]|jgi:hypothetical protein|nr:hypothetical protein [Thermoanaerobaculia bacterium]